MKKVKHIYETLTEINSKVKQNLRQKGLVVPIQLDDGSIKIGTYIVNKNNNGFFEIKSKKELIVSQINLAQTALIVANKLALGKWLDNELLDLDRKYGYAFFEEQVSIRSKNNSIKNKNLGRVDIMENKLIKAKLKKNYFKKTIIDNFRKLVDIR